MCTKYEEWGFKVHEKALHLGNLLTKNTILDNIAYKMYSLQTDLL